MTFKPAILITLLSQLTYLAACGDGGSSESQGINLGFSVAPLESATNASNQNTGTISTFSNSEGTNITLNTAYLTVWSVELNNDCTGSFFTKLPFKLIDFILPSAHAHADESPLVLSTPYVIDLLTDTQVDIGKLSPPPDTYCGSSISFFPADSDAEDLPESPNMVGRTLYIDGSYTEIGGIEKNFTIDLSTRLREKGLNFPSLLSLNSDNLTGSMTISLNYTDWFDGINFNQLATSESQNRILENLRGAVTIQ